ADCAGGPHKPAWAGSPARRAAAPGWWRAQQPLGLQSYRRAVPAGRRASARWTAAAGPARERRRVPGDAVLRRAAAAVPLWRPARPEPVPVRVRIAPAAMAPAAA